MAEVPLRAEFAAGVAEHEALRAGGQRVQSSQEPLIHREEQA